MIAAVLLAAGTAQRFGGSQKLLVPLPNDAEPMPLVRLSAIGVLEAGVERVVVVVGREARAVRDCLHGLALEFVTNADYASGMSSSLRTGVGEAMRLWPEARGLLIALGDQPLGGTGIIEAVVRRGAEGDMDGRITAPRFRGELGNPVLFGRELVPELLEVTGDRGARGVIERERGRVDCVDFDRAAPLDVDRAEDLSALEAARRKR
jgi:molybdenum cofactor cytidylyltransferase